MARRRRVDKKTEALEQYLRSRRHESLRVDGYELTDHAVARMAARLIEIDWVSDALGAPSRPSTEPGTRKHVGDMAMCIVDPKRRIIVTVGHGRLNEGQQGRKAS